MWTSLNGRVPLAPKRKELQVRCKTLFGESSLPEQWLCSLKCQRSPGSTRKSTSLQERRSPLAVCLTPDLLH